VAIGILAVAAIEGWRNLRDKIVAPQSKVETTTSAGTTAGSTLVVPAPERRPVSLMPRNEPVLETEPLVEPPSASTTTSSVATITYPETTNQAVTHTSEHPGSGPEITPPQPVQRTPDLVEGDRQRARALAFSNAHQWQEAATAWQQFIHDYSGVKPAADHAAYYNLGIAYESLQNWHEAAEAFERAAVTNNGSSDTNNQLHLARCYGKLGRWNDAVATYEGVLRSEPQNEIAKRSLPLALQQAPRGQ
jgi:tetratricopeptide (TPR) repeat protein